jgi:hypothetical protein
MVQATAITIARGDVGFGMILPFRDHIREAGEQVSQATVLIERLDFM